MTSMLLISILLMSTFVNPVLAENDGTEEKPWMNKDLSAEGTHRTTT